MASDVPTIPDLMAAADSGDGPAAKALFATLYDELHRLAEHHLARAGGYLTLGTTTLLHEAYFKLADREGARFPDRHRFLGYASRALRTLVIDYIRARRAQKRGGEYQITGIDGKDPPGSRPDDDQRLDQLAAGLERLAAIDADLAQLVDLHFFGGFTLAEAAAITNSSLRTTERRWQKARLLLQRLLADADTTLS